MFLKKFFKQCTPSSPRHCKDRIYHKTQKVLAELRAESHALSVNAEWSRQHQSDTEDDHVIDVSIVGECCPFSGRMSLEKFKKLNRDQRADWIDFNDRLIAVTNAILRDTEVSVQVLHTLKELLELMIDPIEKFILSPPAKERIRSLKSTYFNFARTVKTEGRIRVRYIRILNSSHSEDIFAVWNKQLQHDLTKSTKYSKLFQEFIDAATGIVEELLSGLTLPQTSDDAAFKRHQCAMLKSKRDILNNKYKTNRAQAESWKQRSQTAGDNERTAFAAESARRAEAYAKCADLYKAGFDLMDKLYERMNAELESFHPAASS